MNGAGIQRARIFHMVANMKVSTLISEYNTDRPNQVDDSRKINWLKKVEAMIIREVVSTHQGGSLDTWTVDGTTLTIGSTIYDTDIEAIISDFGDDTELIVPDPYSDLYMFWLDERIALMNNEAKRYSSVSTLFNNAYVTFQQWYNRTHMPLSGRSHFINHEEL